MTRILYVPNERGDFRQSGFRRPFANLVSAGLLDEVRVFSLLLRIDRGGDPRTEIDSLIARIAEVKPDIVLMQHLSRTGLTDRDLRRMRAVHDFELVYHEADPYSRFLHPLPSEARAAGAHSDVTFTVGSGVFAQNFVRAGARDVRWASHVFDPDRYGKEPPDSGPSRPHDVVVVANRSQPRLAFRGVPGWRERIAFVELLQRRMPDRVAIYGRGWDGPGAMGPVPFDEQSRVIRESWISANWDHYAKEPRYYSNRLPISLASGSVHVTTHHDGVGDIFGELPFLFFERSIHGVVDRVEQLLEDLTPADFVGRGAAARAFAFERFRQDDQLVEFLNYRERRVDPAAARAAWDLDEPMLEEI